MYAHLFDDAVMTGEEPKEEYDLRAHAKVVSEALHDQEEALKARAAELPEGLEKDELQIKGERLSDEAWHIEEEFDLEPRPSGLWPKIKED
jgi:hypothetical protein